MDLEPWDPLDHPARIEVRRQESDDSDAEGGLGNVTRVVLRPPGHSGKAKRGHLCFDASFEGGNLGRVDFISEYEYDLFIRPDTCNPRYRLWFNFVVDNVRADQRVIFNLVNLCKIKTLFRDGMTPLVKTSSRPKWQRLPGKYVYYHKSPEHRNHYILSFAFAFDREEDVYQFAFSFPYSYSRCQAHLELLEQREFSFFRRETIGSSLQNRKLDVITISNLPSPALVAGKRPKLVIILARSNPGESPTSYIAQGLMDFLVSNHPLAVALRDYVVIKIVPMINPDGVFLGNLRTTLMGYDLNRHWNQVSPWSHPTLHAIKNYLIDLDASKTLELDMVIDLHSHASLMGSFIYGNAYDDVYRFERHILFPKLLAHNAEDYNPSHTMYNRDPNKAGSARRHLCEILKNTVNVYTLEASYFGYNQPLTNSIITYNEDGYLRLGRNLARTFFEYYKVTGIIPNTVLSTAPSGPNNPDDNDKKIVRASSKARATRARSRTKGKLRDKSGTRSPSAPKVIPNNERKSDENDLEETLEGKQDKTIVKLSQLTKETVNHTDSSDSLSSNEDARVRVTKNNLLSQQQQNAQRRSSTTKVIPSSRPSGASNAINGSSRLNTGKINGHNKDSSPPSPGSPPPLLGENNQKKKFIKKAAYQTFDFSILKNHNNDNGLPRGSGITDEFWNSNGGPGKRFTHRRTDVPERARKIGGGGVVSRRKGRARDFKSTTVHTGGGGAGSETETDAPCLTIIDFNMLIRKTLEGKGSLRERGWRGWSSGRKIRENSRSGGQGADGQRIGERRRNNVRRRRAVLLRGTVTDCSPWDGGTSSDSDSSSNLSAPPTHNLGNLKHHLNKTCVNNSITTSTTTTTFPTTTATRIKRRKSPATPTLSPSPIFLPQ